ncbi:hypothetical protein [Thermoflexibacter ruber]|uniref:Uncharacterized protein n=1 Tax=Thermoflexibacter ruber TaxID=1003 RepID=A0A1I2HBK1_9BACT|nr:hypothetical protein [Thermoflexibacter ruber]SFF27032.1 hypothetical protein SAMN04488541_10233 [Thermoflexibacter ruber]
MKKNIGRTLFWFKDGDEKLHKLADKYFGLGTLLNRLMNEVYIGKKIIFININFYSELSYKIYDGLLKHYTHFGGQNLTHNAVLDFEMFYALTEEEKEHFLWKRGYEILQEAAIVIKNPYLAEASKYAYQKGLETNLNLDFRVLEVDIMLYDVPLKACVWIRFTKEEMYSQFTLEKNGIIIFEKHLMTTVHGVEFFLEMYKKIEVKDNIILLRGAKEAKLPMKIPIEEEIVKGKDW